MGINIREGSKVTSEGAGEVEYKFEKRRLHIYTEAGEPLRGEYADSWYDDEHEVNLYVHIDKWPRGGDDWNAVQRFLLQLDNNFRHFLDTQAEAARNEAARDDPPF